MKVGLINNVEEFRIYPEAKGKRVKSVKQKRDMFGFVFEKYSDYSMEKKLEGDRIGGRGSNMMTVTIPQEERTRT